MPDYTELTIESVKPNPRNARTHSKKQIRQIADSIRELGFAAPILVDEGSMVIAGHGRLSAARLLGMPTIPAIIISGLSESKKRALMLADNRIALNAGWDREQLAIELGSLDEMLALEQLEIAITGFDAAEIDFLHADFEDRADDPVDEFDRPTSAAQVVSKIGDSWQLGRHKLTCGDAQSDDDIGRVMGSDRASMAFLDPPYNVRIRDVVGRGATKHREFAMASGEMSRTEFTDFLKTTLAQAARWSNQTAVHFVCMDWRHLDDMMLAGRHVYTTMLNLVVWVKSNAGQGSFYRSQHEMVGVYRVGSLTHQNNIELGRHGRNRSNVWRYAGVNTFRSGRKEDLAAHPTVKPVAMIADAIKDCTSRGEIVLDTFCGSGSTILAAERVGRRAVGLEIDPLYVDVAIRRWQSFTGLDALHCASGLTFEEMARQTPHAKSQSVPTRKRG